LTEPICINSRHAVDDFKVSDPRLEAPMTMVCKQFLEHAAQPG
jgi:hypothetical protein